jgi:hypothetical protein
VFCIELLLGYVNVTFSDGVRSILLLAAGILNHDSINIISFGIHNLSLSNTGNMYIVVAQIKLRRIELVAWPQPSHLSLQDLVRHTPPAPTACPPATQLASDTARQRYTACQRYIACQLPHSSLKVIQIANCHITR